MLDSWVKFKFGDKFYIGKVIKDNGDILTCKADGDNYEVERKDVEVLVEGKIVRKGRNESKV